MSSVGLSNEFFSEELFNVNQQEIEECKAKFQYQCPILYELYEDYVDFFIIITIEQKNICMYDYLLHLASEWRRNRIEYGDTFTTTRNWLLHCVHPDTMPDEFKDIPVMAHWNKLKHIQVPNYTCEVNPHLFADTLVSSALYLLCVTDGRDGLYHPLIVPHSFRINDCLESTVKYICAAVEWIDGMIKRSKTSIFPFQVDVCIHYAVAIDSNDDCIQIPISNKKATFQQFDDALRRYYKSMGAEYTNQFSAYSEEYGFDDLAEDITVDGAKNCMMLEFDENIPLAQEAKNRKDREDAIFQLLFKIYNDPYYDVQRPYNINQTYSEKIGDINPKLEETKSKYAYIECDSNGVFYSNTFIVCSWIRININNCDHPNEIVFLLSQYLEVGQLPSQTQSFVKLFGKFTEQNNVETIKNKRFITFVDRRNSAKNIDTLWMFEPFKCADIPNDAVPYWSFNASKTFLLPNNINVDNANDKEENALLLTFSFHVNSADSIKCFLYFLHGEMMEFMPQDIQTVLPKLFTMNLNATFDGSVNAQFAKNKNKLSQFIRRVNQTLHTRSFNLHA